MPLLTLDRKDLHSLLNGQTITHPITGLRVVVETEVLEKMPVDVICDVLDALKQ